MKINDQTFAIVHESEFLALWIYLMVTSGKGFELETFSADIKGCKGRKYGITAKVDGISNGFDFLFDTREEADKIMNKWVAGMKRAGTDLIKLAQELVGSDQEYMH